MAILDPFLASVVESLLTARPEMATMRKRGGLARGIAWVEISQRRTLHGCWVEMRLHHQPTEQRVQMGMLVYAPLALGGRTTVVAEWSATYINSPDEQRAPFELAINRALDTLERDH